MPPQAPAKQKRRTLLRQPAATSNTATEEPIPDGAVQGRGLLAGAAAGVGAQPQRALGGQTGIAGAVQDAAQIGAPPQLGGPLAGQPQVGGPISQLLARPTQPAQQQAQMTAEPATVGPGGATGLRAGRQQRADDAIVGSYLAALQQAQASGNAQAVANINRVLQSDRYAATAQKLQAAQPAPGAAGPTGGPGTQLPPPLGIEQQRTLARDVGAFPSHPLVTPDRPSVSLAQSAGRRNVVAEVGERQIVQTDVIKRMRREGIKYDEALNLIKSEAQGDIQRIENIKTQRAQRKDRRFALETERQTAQAAVDLAKSQFATARTAEKRADASQKAQAVLDRQEAARRMAETGSKLMAAKNQAVALERQTASVERGEREEVFQNELKNWTSTLSSFEDDIKETEKRTRDLLKDPDQPGVTLDRPLEENAAEFRRLQQEIVSLKGQRSAHKKKRPKRSAFMSLKKELPIDEEPGARGPNGAPAAPQAGARTLAAPSQQIPTTRSGVGLVGSPPPRTLSQAQPEMESRTIVDAEGVTHEVFVPVEQAEQEFEKTQRLGSAAIIARSVPLPGVRPNIGTPGIQEQIDANPDRFEVRDVDGQLKVFDKQFLLFTGDHQGPDPRQKPAPGAARNPVREAVDQIFPDRFKTQEQLTGEFETELDIAASAATGTEPGTAPRPKGMLGRRLAAMDVVAGQQKERGIREKAERIAPFIGKKIGVAKGAGAMNTEEMAETSGMHFVNKYARHLPVYQAMGPDEQRDALVNFLGSSRALFMKSFSEPESAENDGIDTATGDTPHIVNLMTPDERALLIRIMGTPELNKQKMLFTQLAGL